MHQLLTKDEETQTKLDDTQAELTQNKAMYEQKILVIQKEKYQLQTDIQEVIHSFNCKINLIVYLMRMYSGGGGG